MLEKAKLAGILIGAVLFLVVVLQNTDVVTIHFLWLTGSLPLAALLLLTLIAGVLGGWLGRKLLHLRRSRHHN